MTNATTIEKKEKYYGVWCIGVRTRDGGAGIGNEWVGTKACATTPDAFAPNPAVRKLVAAGISPLEAGRESHPAMVALWSSKERAWAEIKAFQPEKRVLDAKGHDLAESVREFRGPGVRAFVGKEKA